MRPVLIVAHGQPSDPGPPEARLAALGRRVAALRRGLAVATATLAMPGALARAAAALPGTEIEVYPVFMSDGWFVSAELPRRLARDVPRPTRILAPLGLDPGLAPLVRRVALDGMAEAGLDPAASLLILAAHGSPRDPRPAAAARAIGRRISAGFAGLRYGFVDEAPHVEDAARAAGPALCLPLFVDANSHVREDLPRALAAAGFAGPLLPPIGRHPAVADLIASALAEGARAAQSSGRFSENSSSIFE